MMLWVGLAVALGIVAFIGAKSWSAFRRNRADRTPPYILALRALADGDDETALTQFREAAREGSGGVDAYLRLGELFRQRGDARRAFQVHRELTTRRGLSRTVRARVQRSLALDLLDLGRAKAATEAAAEAVRLASNPKEELRVLAYTREEAGEFDGAFKATRDLARLSEDLGPAELAAYRASQAERLLEDGDLDGAARTLKEARKIDASCALVGRVQGFVEEAQGKLGAAIESWEGALAADPVGASDLFPHLERVRFLDGSFGEMERSYRRVLEACPGHEAGSFGLALFLRRKGELDGALAEVHRGRDEHPESDRLADLEVGLLLQMDRVGEAGELLDERIASAVPRVGGIVGESKEADGASETDISSLTETSR
ncbi:MAG: hypothetical protein QF904_04660 [Gemmatimonadota bacterium]|nr:hypothetical protein [Gemmatimonadota bacterium]MDP7031571.1 hypothetical protein [Gemmatimonadota bacterium]